MFLLCRPQAGTRYLLSRRLWLSNPYNCRLHGPVRTSTNNNVCIGEGFSVAFDPLDGSSIVDTNFSVGTIFGIWPGDKLKGITGASRFASQWVLAVFCSLHVWYPCKPDIRLIGMACAQ